MSLAYLSGRSDRFASDGKAGYSRSAERVTDDMGPTRPLEARVGRVARNVVTKVASAVEDVEIGGVYVLRAFS